MRLVVLTLFLASFAAHAQPAPAPPPDEVDAGPNGANGDDDDGSGVIQRDTQQRNKQEPPNGCGCTSSSAPTDALFSIAAVGALAFVRQRRRTGFTTISRNLR